MKIVVLGLSITSAWGNGHATTYRSLVRELSARGHDVLFLERDQPWYAENRDLPAPDFCEVELYRSVAELKSRFSKEIRAADCVIVGSYVTEGVAVGEWVTDIATGVTAFYDIDTPVTLAKLAQRDHEYLSPELIPRFDRYLSFTGGPTLARLEQEFGSPGAWPVYCSVDPALYFPEEEAVQWDLGYLGTYSNDRQPALQRLLLEPATQLPSASFVVAGPLYPESIRWPENVERIPHLSPAHHRSFYNRQRFTLNVTRAAMVRAGYAPSVRLFEAAACATPTISDAWPGLETLFQPGREILIAHSTAEALRFLREIDEDERRSIGESARRRVLAEHTAGNRAAELEAIIENTAPPAPRKLQEALS